MHGVHQLSCIYPPCSYPRNPSGAWRLHRAQSRLARAESGEEGAHRPDEQEGLTVNTMIWLTSSKLRGLAAVSTAGRCGTVQKHVHSARMQCSFRESKLAC
eukprot:1160153-Pelagomonas_calceolata.AAC.1